MASELWEVECGTPATNLSKTDINQSERLKEIE